LRQPQLAGPFDGVSTAHLPRSVAGRSAARAVGGLPASSAVAARHGVPADLCLRADLAAAAGAVHELLGAAEEGAEAARCLAAAEAQYAAAVALCPAHAPALVRLAGLALQQQQQQLAHASASASSAGSDGADADAHGLVQRGLELARAALRADPRDGAAWGVAARLEAAAGRHQEACDAAARALQLQAVAPLLTPALLPWRLAQWD